MPVQVNSGGSFGPAPVEIIVQNIIQNSVFDTQYHYVGPYELLNQAKKPQPYPIITASGTSFGFNIGGSDQQETFVRANISVIFQRPKNLVCDNPYLFDNYIVHLASFHTKALLEIGEWFLGMRKIPSTGRPLVEFDLARRATIDIFANRELGESLRDQAEAERKLSLNDLVVVEMVLPLKTCYWQEYCTQFTPTELDACDDC